LRRSIGSVGSDRREEGAVVSTPRPESLAAPRLLKVKEVAGRLGVTTRTVQTWIHLGRLTPIRLSARVLRISEDEVGSFIAQATARPPAPRA
jgi:excisionase family DNA binding protein